VCKGGAIVAVRVSAAILGCRIVAPHVDPITGPVIGHPTNRDPPDGPIHLASPGRNTVAQRVAIAARPPLCHSRLLAAKPFAARSPLPSRVYSSSHAICKNSMPGMTILLILARPPLLCRAVPGA
jgi:hypothetical protein